MLQAEGVFKKCGKCGAEKPASQFNSCKHNSLGLAWQCKSCHSAYVKQHYRSNRERVKESRKARHKAESLKSKDGLRLCEKCCEKKPFSSFLPSGNWWCVECRRSYAAKWRQENKDTQKHKVKAWRTENRERINAVRQSKRVNRPNYALAERIRDVYGMSFAQYEEMLKSSGGLCAICRKPTEKLHIDHNHTTGKVRDLLCQGCNQGIGCFCEDPQILKSAIAYIKKHNGGDL